MCQPDKQVKISFYSGLSIRIADSVRDECDAEDVAETLHLRCDICVRATAVGHNDAGIVDNASGTDAIHKFEGLREKNLGFKTGKRRIVLDEQFTRAGQDKACALGLEFLTAHNDRMRRRIVLHLLAGVEVIGPGPIFFLIFPELQLSRQPGEGAVGDHVVVCVLQDFLNTNHIPQTGFEPCIACRV